MECALLRFMGEHPVKAQSICSALAVVLVGMTACASTTGDVSTRLVRVQATPVGPSCYGDSSLPWAQPRDGLTSVRVSNADQHLQGFFPGALTDSEIDPAVADQAALDFGCPVSSVRVASRPTTDFAWGVAACGHRGAYVVVQRDVTTSAAPEHEGRCLVMKTLRFLRLGEDPAAATERMDATYRGPPPAAGSQERLFASPENVTRIQSWGALVEQASKDLACPRDEIVPGFWTHERTTTPVADGCGQRATYLAGRSPPFLVQSVVHVAE
jgi:hypothetical protein